MHSIAWVTPQAKFGITHAPQILNKMHRTSAQTKAVCSTVALRAKGKDCWWFGTCFFFHILGIIIQMTNIFQRGWNHQPEDNLYLGGDRNRDYNGDNGNSMDLSINNEDEPVVWVCHGVSGEWAIDPKDGPGNVPRGFWDLATGMGQNLCDHTWGGLPD